MAEKSKGGRPNTGISQRQLIATLEKNDRTSKGLRKKGDPKPCQVPVIAEGEASKFSDHVMAIASLPKIDWNKPEMVEYNCHKYLERCSMDDIKPTVAGLAIAVGLSRTEFLYGLTRTEQWCKKPNPDSVLILKKYYLAIGSLMENLMVEGKIQPLAGIFLMKNNLNYTDKTEYVITPNNQQTVDVKELISQAEDLPDD